MIATRRLRLGADAPLYELATGRRPWTEYRRRRELQWRAPEELDSLAETARRLERALAEFLGGGMRVAVERVDHIVSEPSGKRLIIRSAAPA
jgi:hypothetical protein